MTWPFTKVATRPPVGWKTAKGDQFTWVGMWEGRGIRFRSEPKLLSTDLYFNTSSNARIQFTRDLGACYIDLCVIGWIAADSLARLAPFAQQFDTRQVRARTSKSRISRQNKQ